MQVLLLLLLLLCALVSDIEALRLDRDDARHVRAIFIDLVGRSPDSDEAELAASSSPRNLVRSLAGSREFWEHWYEDELQYFLLVDNQRPDDPAPGDALPARLAAGELGVVEAVRGIVSGSAFHRANPGNDTFVSVVLEQLLDVTVQQEHLLLASGKKMYDGHRASLFGSRGSSQADVVRIVCEQPEFLEVFLTRQYERLVGRPPDEQVIAEAVAVLEDDPGAFPDVVVAWLLSDAYAERIATLRPKTDRQFVRTLYVDLTGVPPDEETLRRHRRALAAVADGGPLRSVIARALLEQQGAGRLPQDPESLVIGVFERFLGRRPGPAELQDFLATYAECECPPETIVRAVTSHWEYQYY